MIGRPMKPSKGWRSSRAKRGYYDAYPLHPLAQATPWNYPKHPQGHAIDLLTHRGKEKIAKLGLDRRIGLTLGHR
jgi:hypothetical protein